MHKVLIGAVTAAGLMAFSTTGAMAAIACTGNVCWHVKERYEYPPAAKVIVHEDDWKPAPSVVIREHEGRGYWKGDAWTAW